MSYAIAAGIATGIALPHLLRLERAPPTSAALLWFQSLALRALASLFAAVYLLVYVPSAEPFHGLAHRCLHAALPVLTEHLGLETHDVGHLATALPALLLGVSTLSVAIGIARAARSVRRLLTLNGLGPGPRGSVIVGGADVVLAAAGIRRPTVVVSAGALTALDDDELFAGLDHENGHIARRHGYVFAIAALLRGLGRPIPGARRALRELSFHLERDADRWALARHNDPSALASAICKAAGTRELEPAWLTGLASAGVMQRLDQLLDPAQSALKRARRLALNGLAVTMAVFALAVTAVLPATAAAGIEQLGTKTAPPHCES